MNEEAQVQDTAADDQGWDDAAADFLEEKGHDPKDFIESDDSDDESESESTDDGADDDASSRSEGDEDDESEEDESESDSEENEESEDAQDEPKQSPQAAYREQREVQRQIEADQSSMREDVLKSLYPDFKNEITDADGDVLRTPSDVMSRVNPETGKAFTAEEAVAWLHAQERHLQVQRSEMESKVEQIAEVNLTIRDESDFIKETYGQFLSENPELRDSIYADFQATLVKDPESGIIVNAPISIKSFYERALKPYLDYKTQLESTSQARQDKAAKAEANQKRKAAQTDRQDITPGGLNAPSSDKEEDEWANAAKEYYEGR